MAITFVSASAITIARFRPSKDTNLEEVRKSEQILEFLASVQMLNFFAAITIKSIEKEFEANRQKKMPKLDKFDKLISGPRIS